jgi:RND superfamily putative drug exporter
MQLLGRVNWWLPAWLDRVLPRVQVEGADDHGEPAPPYEEPPARELQPA